MLHVPMYNGDVKMYLKNIYISINSITAICVGNRSYIMQWLVPKSVT